MLCNRKKSSPCLFLLVALLGAVLAGCGGDEPAPAPPPPPPPPPPAFVPQDVGVELGTSGETLTLQTTESGGFTRNGEAFASGTTVEAAGNTYRLVLSDGEWAAEYVAPRPWATALGRSGDALLITRREDGLFEAGDQVFGSGGTLSATNGNQYRLTLNEDTNSWQVEYVPPEPTPILLGLSGQTVLAERLEGGGYSVGGQPVVDGSTIQSASGSTYRLSMQDGAWTASFEPPPPELVTLGNSGQSLTLQRREDGQFTKDGQLYPTGSKETVGGRTYRLELQNGMWTAVFEAATVTVRLGMSGATLTLQELENGDFTKDGQPYPTGSIEAVGDRAYRLVLKDGSWTADFVEPQFPLPLGRSGESLTLLVQEDGSYTREDGTPLLPNSVVEAGGDRYRLVLRNGSWTAIFEAPAAEEVQLGSSGESVRLVAQEGGTYVRADDGTPVRPNDLVEAGGNTYRLVFEGGEWTARYRAEQVVVLGTGDDTIVLLRQENGDYLHNGRTVASGDTVEVGGNRYVLTLLSDGEWIGERTSSATARSVDVSVGTQTITLTRTSTGTYTYNGNPVSTGSQITVGNNRYVLTQASDGTWSGRAVSDSTTTDTGGVGGPTTTDTVNDFTDGRFDDDLSDNLNDYGVRLSIRGEQPDVADDRGTKIVPQRMGAKHVEFPIYELMQQELATQERTYVDVAKAKLQEIVDIIRLNKDLYARDARDPDDHIADDTSDTAASGIGLWRQAEMAVGMIFGLTDTDADEMDGILGGDPWRGLTLDFEEVDDVIEALEDTIATLSDVGKFGREYEDRIAAINGGTDGDIDTTGDNLDPKLDAADFFNGLMTRIRFGSTVGTRFGAYVVKDPDSADGASDAARGGWTRGVFAYTPSDEPSATDIPDRGEATYRGSTVAVSEVPTTDGDVDEGNGKGATLYAGKIELVASFTRKNVKGTITELKDESGRTWVHDDGYGNEDVKSIVLPDAALSTTTGEAGFYQESTDGSGAPATAIFADTSLPNASGAGAKFRVQLVDDAGEALGVWEAFTLEGAFGATRTGTVSKPTLPAEADRGGGATTGSIHYFTNATVGSGTGGPISTIDTEESLFSLSRTDLGIATNTEVISEDEFNRDFTDLKLTDLYRKSRPVRSGSTFASEARTRISRLRTGLNDSNHATRAIDAGTILSNFLGTSKTLASDDRSTTNSEIGRLLSALGSSTSLHRALSDTDGYLNGLETWSLDETRQVYSEKRWDFKYDFGRNRYTRFGVWSQIAPATADANVGGATDDPNHGSFAYSPLHPAVAGDLTSLTFAATYEGRTLAVNRSTGDLYAGQFILRVDWSDSTPSVRTTITDLRGVRGTSDYFKYGTKDVKSIFFTGLTGTAGAIDDSSVQMSVRYRDSSQDTPAAGGISATMSGSFVMDQEFTDEPVGVLGVWSILDSGTTVDDYSGSFGAELKP